MAETSEDTSAHTKSTQLTDLSEKPNSKMVLCAGSPKFYQQDSTSEFWAGETLCRIWVLASTARGFRPTVSTARAYTSTGL